MGKIMVGISAWADAELAKSGFYPAGIDTPTARLKYYASRFSIAEIDSNYHFFPTRRNLALWLDNTPEGFKFNVKAFSLFTQHPTPLSSLPRTIREKYAGKINAKGNVYLHHLPEEAVDELWSIFTGTLDAFREKGKLGAVLFQFAPWFHPEPRNYDYIGLCRDRLAKYPVAVEFQVASWLDKHREETLKFLRERSLALVCVDEPQGLKSSIPQVHEVTGPLAVVRFHGRNRENWESKEYAAGKFNYLYTEAELKECVPKIQVMAQHTEYLHLIFKNKHADYPVKNALMMQELLGLTA
ncbi:MAG: DUF72 domain-containing protein [Dehalococcoidales bacterium]|jgi:uncharacterized protein YecE (DUF72 family)